MHLQHFSVYLLLLAFIIQIFAFTSPSGAVPASTSSPMSQSSSYILPDPHTFDTDIVLLNYVNDLNFTNGILSRLPTTLPVQNGAQSITYHMNYRFVFPNSTFLTPFKNYIATISTPNSSTVDINQTALKYQAVNNTVKNIFIDKIGTSINGTALEHWLWTNGQQFRNANTSYQIFLLNLTYIPSKLYWFNITDEQAHQWRLEWDYPSFGTINNFNVKFPYPGYSSNYPMFYLDPSAFNWYLNWTRIWRNVPLTSNNPFYLNSLSGYLAKNGGFLANETLAGEYIGNWLQEIVRNLFVFQPLNGISSPSSINFQVAVITDENKTNPYPNLHWIINNTLVKQQLNRMLPNAQISMNTTFYNISNYNSVSQLLAQYEDPAPNPPPLPDYKYYNGNSLFYPFISLDSQFFVPSTAAMNLRAYVLILNNASFTGANWNGGGLFTGLGGNGRILILNEVDRLFFNRTTDPIPKESLNKVLIHEAGHAIGLPHPFNAEANSYASDFLDDAMGYYPSTANYSFLFVNNFQRLSLEPIISLVISNLQQLLNINLSQSFEQNLLDNYNLFLSSYHKLDFQTASQYLNTLLTLMSEKITIEPNGPQPPVIFNTPVGGFLSIDSSKTLTWQVYDLNPTNYAIYVNNTIKTSGVWNKSAVTISYTFVGSKIDSYNISLVLYDIFGYSTMNSTFIYVTENYTSSITSTSSKTATHTTPIDPIYSIMLPALVINIFFTRKKAKRK